MSTGLVAVAPAQDKHSGAVGMTHDNGAPSGFSPGSGSATGALVMPRPSQMASAFFDPSQVKCNTDVNSAMSAAMRAGSVAPAVDMAALARAKSATPLVTRQVGAPIQAPIAATPAPVTAAAPMVPQQRALTSTPTERTMTADEALLRDKLSMVTYQVPFAYTTDRTLAGLDGGNEKVSTTIKIPTPSYLDKNRLMFQRVVITRADCDSRQRIGVCFGDLDARFTQSLDAQTVGKSYHLALPVAGQQPLTQPTEVFGKTHMFDPRLVAEYAHVRDIQEVNAQLEYSSVSDYVNVPLNSIVGKIVQRNPDIFTGMAYQNKKGEWFSQLHVDLVKPLLERIDSTILQNPSFRQAINDLSSFDVTLVPLAPTWVHLPTLNVETPEAKSKELNRGFNVHIEGYIEVCSIKPDAVGVAK